MKKRDEDNPVWSDKDRNQYLQRGSQFIFEGFSPYALATFS
jgi:hypothetical protein